MVLDLEFPRLSLPLSVGERRGINCSCSLVACDDEVVHFAEGMERFGAEVGGVEDGAGEHRAGLPWLRGWADGGHRRRLLSLHPIPTLRCRGNDGGLFHPLFWFVAVRLSRHSCN